MPPGPSSPASMPSARNTSSRGAPMRDDRMPAKMLSRIKPAVISMRLLPNSTGPVRPGCGDTRVAAVFAHGRKKNYVIAGTTGAISLCAEIVACGLFDRGEPAVDESLERLVVDRLPAFDGTRLALHPHQRGQVVEGAELL